MKTMDETYPVALVTGGAGAIGQAIAEGLLKKGFAVTVVVRSDSQGKRVVSALETNASAPISYKTCDLSVHRDILALADSWSGPLHVLVNNAATCPRQRTLNAEGIEMQFATNVLAYFRMMNAFADVLTQSAPARIVNVASYWAGGLRLDDLEFTKRPYDNDSVYRQSKQADRMLSRAFAMHFDAHGITVNACHPGDVRSKVSRDLGFGGHESPAQGAATPLYLATSSDVARTSGAYFAHQRQERCQFSEDMAQVMELYAVCGRYDRK
ncbi:MAG: SDR family NAD(P)-dependent oxidoreductase [Deltaproteobacteria bacterium]|nr:SDR family NAD(P)-dependent oxidoreductase [Deltaproteobacteria bacterium]